MRRRWQRIDNLIADSLVVLQPSFPNQSAQQHLRLGIAQWWLTLPPDLERFGRREGVSIVVGEDSLKDLLRHCNLSRGMGSGHLSKLITLGIDLTAPIVSLSTHKADEEKKERMYSLP